MQKSFQTLSIPRNILVLLFFVTAGATVGLGQRQATAKAQSMPITRYLNQAAGIGYVGSKACARCHEDIYHSYMQTLMGRSMTLPGDPAQFALPPAPVSIKVEKFKRIFQVFRSGAELYQCEYEPGPNGASVFRDTRRISYILGAGENGVSYIVQQGNYLFEAPLSYYSNTRAWGLSPGYEFADYGFHRVVPTACIVCHSGRPRPVANRPGLYKDPPFEELAVGCENCHGPGALHVEERTKGAPLSGPIDRTIVNPANLPGWLANNVCMICHQAGDTRILQPGKTYLDFRPGAPLDETVAIFAVPFTRQSPPQDPLLQQYTQMVLSKCYRASGEKMTCITCHNPHFQPTAAEVPAYYQKKCLACHTEASCKLSLAERRQNSPPDNCIGCHMPRQGLQKISHSSLTNHRIIAYAGEPFPNAAFHETTPLLPDLVHINAVPGNEHVPIAPIVLLQAYGELMESHPEYKARYEQLLNALAPLKLHNPLILSALGRRALLSGTADGAIEAQKDIGQAIADESTVASDFEVYANLLMHAGKTEEAIGVLERGIDLNPYSARLYKRLALAYIQTQQYPNALETMKQELKMFPEDSFMRMLITRVQGSAGSPSLH
ncbi:MAG: tetratricopeptide repeat protein [Acidobacteriota bacterium]|nr:tetratricopeptide repeat protein [Acidobacteriota bacterium]